MRLPGRTAWPLNGRTALIVATLASAGILVGQVLDGPAVHAITTINTGAPPSPSAVSAVPFAGGRALVTWTPGTGGESDSYQIETYRSAGTGFEDDGTTKVYGTDAVIGGLRIGSSYMFSVKAVNMSGPGAPANSNGILGSGWIAPPAPANVKLTTDGTDNQLKLSWTPVSSPVAAERYRVGVFEGFGPSRTQVGASACDAPCSSLSLQAKPGTVTSAVVSAINDSGYHSAWSNPVSVPQPCPLACVTVATAQPGGAVQRPADGFLDTNGPANPDGLQPTEWRTNLETLSESPDALLSALKNSAITDLMSDDWLRYHNRSGYAYTPWSNWADYSQWVTSDVHAAEALAAQRNFKISYFEIQNEPFAGYYYSPSSAPPLSETIATVEQQFLVAYRAIKAADPNVRVIGPSLIAWKASANDANVTGVDMRTFLDFCAANGIKLDAITFHANVAYPLTGWYAADGSPAQPAAVDYYTAQLRKMLADRPSLGNPQILVNEYGDPDTSELPGWNVGWIAALDEAGVAGAGRSCWDGCGATLDGLVASDGTSPRPPFWVYSFLSGMTGQTVPVTSSFTDVTGLASVASDRTISMLLGRHQGKSCDPGLGYSCPSYPPEPANVEVQVPGANSATVTFASIPAGADPATPLDQLATTQLTIPVTNGVISLSTPPLHDGDAVEITVTPSASH